MHVTTVSADHIRCTCHGQPIRLIVPGWRHTDGTVACPQGGLLYDVALYDVQGRPLAAMGTPDLIEALAEAERWHERGARRDLTDLTVYA